MPPTPRSLAAGACTGTVVLRAAARLAGRRWTRPNALLPVLLLALLCLTACAEQPGNTGAAGGSSDEPAAGRSSPSENDLTVEFDRGEGSGAERFTLTCGGAVEGTHPSAQAACDHLSGMADPFAPIPEDAMCTEQYDGPQTAHVTGRWGGKPVDLMLSRVNGCVISQWDSLGPLLPS
ncbi:MAG: Protease inhibitor [Blastococcus sp.]|nr:Protease inhibitor [Blastococcus sp.]